MINKQIYLLLRHRKFKCYFSYYVTIKKLTKFVSIVKTRDYKVETVSTDSIHCPSMVTGNSFYVTYSTIHFHCPSMVTGNSFYVTYSTIH